MSIHKYHLSLEFYVYCNVIVPMHYNVCLNRNVLQTVALSLFYEAQLVLRSNQSTHRVCVSYKHLE